MIINISLFLLFFIIKAIADKLLFHFHTSIFSNIPIKYHNFWDPSVSWKNKWKNNDKSQGERFIGSSTIFVMFTDMWHLLKFIQYNILTIIMVLNNQVIIHPIIDYVLYLVISLSLFELLFSKILKK